jgi:pimeloyl-ACP methyl ester carboxylesterase
VETSLADGTERVRFTSRSGARLSGIWHEGVKPAGVVVCHGMESCKEGTKPARIAAGLAAAGFHALRFDFSYVGESEGEFADLTISGEVEDLAGAWRYARERIPGPIGIIGSSLGGTVALLFASGEPEVAALATIAAVAHPGRLARNLPESERERWRREGIYEVKGMRLRSGFLADVEALDVPATLPNLRCPLLATHGTEDDVVPYGDAEEIARSAGGAARVLGYEGGDHRFSDPVLLDRLIHDLVGWMTDRLDAALGDEGGDRAEVVLPSGLGEEGQPS